MFPLTASTSVRNPSALFSRVASFSSARSLFKPRSGSAAAEPYIRKVKITLVESIFAWENPRIYSRPVHKSAEPTEGVPTPDIEPGEMRHNGRESGWGATQKWRPPCEEGWEGEITKLWVVREKCRKMRKAHENSYLSLSRKHQHQLSHTDGNRTCK